MGKLTEEELGRIQGVRKEVLELVYALGELEYQKIGIENAVSEVKEKVKAVKVKEAQVLTDLTEKYGKISVNIETGEF